MYIYILIRIVLLILQKLSYIFIFFFFKTDILSKQIIISDRRDNEFFQEKFIHVSLSQCGEKSCLLIIIKTIYAEISIA